MKKQKICYCGKMAAKPELIAEYIVKDTNSNIFSASGLVCRSCFKENNWKASLRIGVEFT